MPSFSSKLQLSSTAQSSNIVFADVDRIKGAFKTYASASTMNAVSPNYFSDGQIVYAEDSGSLFKATVTPADPGQGIFEDSVSFTAFSFDSGSFVSASFDGTNTLTFFGEVVEGSARISMSVDLSALTGSGGGGGGSGDITAVINGSGLLGGALSGNATLSVDSASLAGNGLEAPVGGQFNVATGSTHFTQGVQKVDLDGGEV